MGAKANNPSRASRSKRPAPLSSEEAASGKAQVRGERVSARRAGRKAAKKKHRLYPESVPPAMVHEVFDVSEADAPRKPSLPPPTGARRRGPQRMVSKPPPAPPRPSLAPAASDANEIELDEDVLTEDDSEPSSTLPPTSASATNGARVVSAGLWLVIGAGALGLGVVLGTRTRTLGPERPATEQRVSPPVTATPVAVAIAASAAPAAEVAAPATEVAETESSAAAPSASEATSAVGAAPVVHAPRVDLDAPPFDAEAATLALNAAFERAKACRGPSDPPGEVTATLTYAPSGRITSATVSGVFAGTPVGGCVAAALRSARVPAFSGDYLTVKRTRRLE